MATEKNSTSKTEEKSWKDQFKRKSKIYDEISKQAKERRKRYQDLNDLFEKRERVVSLSSSIPEGKRDEETDSLITAASPFVPKAFIKCDELHEAIEIALATGFRVYGHQEGVNKEDILEYVKKLFDLTQNQVDEAEEKSSQQPSNLQLVCKVIKATDLKPKGIVDQRHYHPGSAFKYMTEWQKTGDITEIATTAYKPATLEPVWNEDVELAVTNVEEQVLVVEVWDHSLLENDSKKKRRTLSYKRNNKEDFLGWMFHPLLLVPIAGAELKVTLMSRSKKPLNGFITLFLSIQADTDDKPLEERLHEHHLLTRAVIDAFSKEDDIEYKLYWSGELTSETEQLLEYHGALSGLNKLQMAAVRLSELLKYHKFESIDINAFSKVIRRMKQMQYLLPELESSAVSRSRSVSPQPSSPANLTPSTPSDHPSLHSSPPHTPTRSTPEPQDTHWVKDLFSMLTKLEAELMDTLKDHIRLVNLGYEGKAEKINPYLIALQELYTFRAFVNQMNPKKELRVELERCIEPSVDSWFRWLKAKVMPNNGSHPKELRDLCIYCLTWTEEVVDKLILHPTFTQADVGYFTLYIMSLDEQLSEEVWTSLQKYEKQKPDTITFEVYTKFQELVELSKNAEEDVQSQLMIVGFHKWFKEFVSGWINVATEKCEARIRQAIELDEIVKITDDLKLSASAVDTNGFLLQMATFWKHLDWPVASEAYGYAVSLIQNMCNCACIFVSDVFASLQPKDTLDDQGRFKASEKLCVVLNNMFHVREHLAEMPTHMELDKLYRMLLEEDMKKYELREEGGPDISEMHNDPLISLDAKAKSLLSNLLASADEDIMNKIDKLVSKICQNIRPDIQKLIVEIVASDVSVNDEMVIVPLFDYLHQNLITLGANLLPKVFESIAGQLWEISVVAIANTLEESQKKNFTVYHRLLYTLKSLREFFYVDGAGVSRRVLDSTAYTSLRSKLDILGMTTDELIVHFYSDLLKRQQEESRGDQQFGKLVVSVGYARESSVLEVSVIHGDNMEMIYEPYVKLRLSSVCKASDSHWKTKSIKGLQKSPVFDQDFRLPISQEEMASEGSLLMFYLIDRKLKSKSPFAVCVISCKKIPHIFATTKSSLMDPTAPQRKNSILPLFRFGAETTALTELIVRADQKDAKALNFLKVSELLLSSIPNLSVHPQRKRFASLTSKGRSNTVT